MANNEIERLMHRLALIAMKHPGCDAAVDNVIDEVIGLVRHLQDDKESLAAEVERLRPREMTLKEAVAVLNKEQYCDCDDWEVYDYDTHTAAECSRGIELIPFEAVAVAEKLLREKEADRG